MDFFFCAEAPVPERAAAPVERAVDPKAAALLSQGLAVKAHQDRIVKRVLVVTDRETLCSQSGQFLRVEDELDLTDIHTVCLGPRPALQKSLRRHHANSPDAVDRGKRCFSLVAHTAAFDLEVHSEERLVAQDVTLLVAHALCAMAGANFTEHSST